jgi:hypothetical protein
VDIHDIDRAWMVFNGAFAPIPTPNAREGFLMSKNDPVTRSTGRQ